jgi:hypothetical protein
MVSKRALLASGWPVSKAWYQGGLELHHAGLPASHVSARVYALQLDGLQDELDSACQRAADMEAECRRLELQARLGVLCACFAETPWLGLASHMG